MAQAVKCDLLLYADDSCLIFEGKTLEDIKNRLNEDFSTLCDWFVDNKLSIHFGEDKTKSIVFGTTHKLKNIEDIDIRYGDVKIKQYSEVIYLGCTLDSNLSGNAMALQALKKINGRLKFLYRSKTFLTDSLKRLMCNALIQPHFDFACLAWYPNLRKNIIMKVQTSQNKCIRFCLNMGNRDHIGFAEFRKINWLPTRERFEQCVLVNIFKFFSNSAPKYFSEMYHPDVQGYNTRSSYQKLKPPFRKTNKGQNTLSYLGPKLWNKLPEEVKMSTNANNFKHKLKANFFTQLQKRENSQIHYY